MQALVNYKVTHYSKFKNAFDEDAEDRSHNGMSLLQLWRENNGSAWALFQLQDAKKAHDYLNGAAGVFNSLAGVETTSIHILEIA